MVDTSDAGSGQQCSYEYTAVMVVHQQLILLENAYIDWIGYPARFATSEDRFRLLSSPNSRYMFHVSTRSLRDMLRSRVVY